MKKFIRCVCLAWCLGLCVPAQARLAEVSVFTLGNGLEVAVIENHKAPVVLQMLYYKTGSMYDPKGKGGIAHLLEHLMFRGTKKVPDKEFNRLMHDHGAENNAYTTFDETGYYEFSDISKLELMMALEADRMTGLEISEEAFKTERDIVLEERKQRFESNPSTLFYETMRKLLWQDSPMANPVSGSAAEIKGLESDDARAFYKRWYMPSNALLVLAGDITVEEAKRLSEKYYGGVKSGEADKTSFEPVAGRVAEMTVSMKVEGVENPRYMSLIRLEAGDFSKKEVLALLVLAEYLAGDDTAFLYDRLVYQEKKLLSVDMDVSYQENTGGAVSFYAVPAALMSGGGSEISAMIEKNTAEGLALLDEEKLEQIKNEFLVRMIYLQENPESAARFAGSMLMAGYSADEIMTYDEAIKAVNLDEIKAVWKKVSALKTKVFGYLEGK